MSLSAGRRVGLDVPWLHGGYHNSGKNGMAIWQLRNVPGVFEIDQQHHEQLEAT